MSEGEITHAVIRKTIPRLGPDDKCRSAQLVKLEHDLDLAKREIHRTNVDLALQLLRNVREMAESHSGTRPWAEHCLLIAEALSAKAARDDDCALSFFEDTVQRLGNLNEPDPELEVRAYVSYGNYLVSILRRRAKARQCYERAKQVSVQHGLEERTAEIQLKIIRIDLESDQDLEMKNFNTMKLVAKEGNYTWGEQLAAWQQHLGETEQGRRGRSFARKEGQATEAYFQSLLDSVRVTSK